MLNNSTLSEPTPPPNSNRRPPAVFDYWRHRRAMTWLALLAGLFLFPMLCALRPALLDLAPSFYLLVSSIIAAYMGTSFFDDARKHDISNQPDSLQKKDNQHEVI